MFPKSQQGFALVTAIFLVVVLAGIGAIIASISINQQVGSTLDLMGANAYQAARSGTEWGLYKALDTSPSCEASTDIGMIGNMSVTTTCTVILNPTASVTEAGMGIIYSITATACNLPSNTTCPGVVSDPNYVERRFTVLADTTVQ